MLHEYVRAYPQEGLELGTRAEIKHGAMWHADRGPVAFLWVCSHRWSAEIGQTPISSAASVSVRAGCGQRRHHSSHAIWRSYTTRSYHSVSGKVMPII